MKKILLDDYYKDLMSNIGNMDAEKLEQIKLKMQGILRKDHYISKRMDIVQRIEAYVSEMKNKGTKEVRVLDFGSGGGQTVVYLLLAGIDVTGVCITENELGNKITNKLGFGDRFYSYDKKTLPFKDKSFHIVFSEQVLEHVLDLDSYYKEASRVLSDSGIAYFSFPQRSMPYDAHTRTWFVHYFPQKIRNALYSGLAKDPSYINDILNFKWTGEHLDIAKKYFSKMQNITVERLISQTQKNSVVFKYESLPRKVVTEFLKAPVINRIAAKAFSQISNVDLVLRK